MSTGIYIADTTALEDSALFERLYALMPLYRRKKIDAMRLPRDKRLSLGAGAALCKALNDLGQKQMPPVACGENGKPYFPDLPALQFNLSHSKTKVMCVISDTAVGCDVEQISAADVRLAKRFFSAKEYEIIADQGSEEAQKRMFCRIWTLKESFMKATGKGFSLPLDQFTVYPDGEKIRLEQTVDAERYAFFELPPEDGFCYACCRKQAKFDTPPKIIRLDYTKL